MSAVQPCLETKEMSKTNIEFLESFETVDEEKDSDEESFHLFLDDDDEENNKSSEKLNTSEILEDANKNSDEEKEKVNVPDGQEVVSVSSSIDSSLENVENPEAAPISEESKNEVHDTTSLSNGIEIQINEPNMSENPVNPDDKHTEENPAPNEENEVEQPFNEIDNNAAVSTVANECEPMEIETNQNENKEEQTKILDENNDNTNQVNLDINTKSNSSENEDDILNKHNTEGGNEECSEDLDPTLEDSLLNETEETNGKKTPEEVSDSIEAPSSELAPEKSECVVNCDPVVSNEDSVDSNETIVAANEVKVQDPPSQKCDDNSNSSNASDSEDLLDISMIKDSAQDDADIAEDELQLEQENEDSDNNAQNISKIVERMESVDESSNMENSDEDVKDTDFENHEILENHNDLSDSEKEKDLCDNEEKMEISEKTTTEELPKVEEDVMKEIENPEPVDDTPDVEKTVKATSKRTISETLSDDGLESEPKKVKFVEASIDEKQPVKGEAWDITELQSLISFSQFMTKSHLKKLTRTDLEEFCIQKLCEAILHKSELGETNHQLKIQEQTIELLRKEQTVLAKQIKDLEIVNKKLMHEVRNHLGNKPIAPVKITRSVGLQVRMAQASDLNAIKRRSIQTTPQKPQSPVVNNRLSTPRPVQNSNTVTRQVITKSPQKPATPILNQVLQKMPKVSQPVKSSPTQNNTSTTPAKPINKPKVTPDKKGKSSSSFIDLTDEDDKKTNTANQNTVKTTTVPQGVRINSVPKTSMPTVVSNNAQVMYVVQSNPQLKTGLLTTAAGQQKAVLVNFQPTNGVINSLNTSSVSVIPKVTTGVHLKTTSTLVKTFKHPAPLPNPPLVQGPNDKSLKSIPPKPFLSIRKTNTGIILQWRMPYDLGLYAAIASYQLYAYQETACAPSTDMWRKVGDVKAMALPMACTLTQFADKNKYYFAVRAVDIHKRIGRFSNPEEISL